MSERPFWVSIVQWTVWGFAMWGIASWFGRARMKRASPGDQVVMTYPLAALVVALICTMSFGAAAVFSFFASAANAPWWTTAIFGVFALGSLHWLAECWVGRYQLSETGLRYVSVFTGTRFFKWDDLQSVKYSPSMRWFILKDSRGQVARISIMMTGLCEFALLVMEHTPNVNIGAYAMPILQKTARGEPPPVWP